MSEPTSVYRYYDEHKVLIYVGITKRGILRQGEHNQHAEWWPYVASQEVDHYDTREIAAAQETFLIRHHRPPFNKAQNPDHERLRAAYFTLFVPRTIAPALSVERKRHAVSDVTEHMSGEECLGGECAGLVGIANHSSCGPGCELCHLAYHGFKAGVKYGADDFRSVLRSELDALLNHNVPAVRESVAQLREDMLRPLVAIDREMGATAARYYFDTIISTLFPEWPTHEDSAVPVLSVVPALEGTES